MLEEPARLADNESKFEPDGLKMGVDPLAAGSLQGAEQPIPPRMISLTLGRSGIVQVPVKWGSARLQGAEQPIASCMISLTFGHGYCVAGAGFGPVGYCGKSVLLWVCYRM